MIDALDSGLSMTGPDTQIIPGHGPLSSPADMKKARDMLVDVQNRIQGQIAEGKDLQEIIGAKPLNNYHELASFINEENMIKITYRSLTGKMD